MNKNYKFCTFPQKPFILQQNYPHFASHNINTKITQKAYLFFGDFALLDNFCYYYY